MGSGKEQMKCYELPESFNRSLALIHLLYPLVNYRHRDNLLTTDFIFRKVNTQLTETSCGQLCVTRDVQIPGVQKMGVPAESWGVCEVCHKGVVRKEESGEEERSGERAV